jgi:hypothetical protein
MIELKDKRIQWSAYETRASEINHERRSEELQLERLKLRLHDKMRDALAADGALTAA